MPECFKDNNASQWKSGKFDPRSLKTPWTDRHLNLHGWLRDYPSWPVCADWQSAHLVTYTIVTDPTIRQPGFDLPCQSWSQVSAEPDSNAHAVQLYTNGALPNHRHATVASCRLYMSHIVDACPLTKFDGLLYNLTTDIHLVSEYGRRPLRSSTDRTLTVPRTHNRFGDRSFAVAGSRLWNSLPISLRQISSYEQFRRYLKNHLFGIWEITAQREAWFSALYTVNILTYLLTYLLTSQSWKLYSD